jgi:hypothetical protein
MNMFKKYFKNRINYFLFIFISIYVYSCGPQINSFTVEPLTISSKDSVKIKWDVSGEATLLFHEKINPDDSITIFREFTLVVQKGGKEVKRFIQVTVIPDESTTEIIFTTSLRGDTLVAEGEKNIARWGNLFQVLNVSSSSGRNLTVKHSGKTAELDKDGSQSNVLEGTPVEGHWEFRSLLTGSEKADLSSAPEFLSIKAIIQYKRR